MQNQENPQKLNGIFIPGEEVELVVAHKRRRSPFLCVYPQALALPSADLKVLLLLADIADYENHVKGKGEEIAQRLGIGHRTLCERLASLKKKEAIAGRCPLIQVSPFYTSKCSGLVLTKLRQAYMSRQVKPCLEHDVSLAEETENA